MAPKKDNRLKRDIILSGGMNCRLCDLYFKIDASNFKYLCFDCREYLNEKEEEDQRCPEVCDILLAMRTKPVYYDEE